MMAADNSLSLKGFCTNRKFQTLQLDILDERPLELYLFHNIRPLTSRCLSCVNLANSQAGTSMHFDVPGVT